MSEISPPSNSQNSAENKSLFSPSLPELCAALDRLYVHNNLSGRLNFRVRWPYAATIVFGDVLLMQDAEGTPDKKAREKLEEESDIRRVELLEALEAIKKESISDGALQTAYAAGVLQRYGKDFTAYIYSEEVIEALAPVAPKAEKVQAVSPATGWKPTLSALQVKEPAREGITYKELIESLAEEETGVPLSVTFNERAYLR